MAKQWSMDEIDNLLESTQENGVSDLVAELMGEVIERAVRGRRRGRTRVFAHGDFVKRGERK